MNRTTTPKNHSWHNLQGTAQIALLAMTCLGAPGCEDVQGVKVYLSPANHGGHNIGCAGFNEDVGARASASSAATFLQDRGYIVKIGKGNFKSNFAESNAWGAHIHVPIHSNAGTWGCDAGSPSGLGGTWGMYRTQGSLGAQLASDIVSKVGPVSPGTNDAKIQRTDLLELKTNARSAYAEMGFHTFYWDVVWLAFDAQAAGIALGEGIHLHCVAHGCKDALVVAEDNEELLRSEGPSATDFDDARGAADHPEIAAELSSWLDDTIPALGGTIISVSELDDTLIVDLEDIRDLGAGHLFFTSGVPAKVFELTSLDSIVFQIAGEAKTFCDWTESDCLPLTRSEPPIIGDAQPEGAG